MNFVNDNTNTTVNNVSKFLRTNLRRRRQQLNNTARSQRIRQRKHEKSKLSKAVSSFFQKPFVLTAYVICIALFIWQFTFCVQRYYEYPISTVTTKKDSKFTHLPSITICNNRMRFSNAIRLNEANLTGPNITNYKDLENMWTKYGVNSSYLTLWRPCNNFDTSEIEGSDVNVTSFYSILGKCIDVTINCPMHQRMYGTDIVLTHNPIVYNITGKSKFFGANYNMYVHARDELYLHDLFENIEWSYIEVEFTIYFQKIEYHYLNSPRKPCIPLQDHINCIDQCVVKRFEANAKCKIPPMRTANLSICTSWSDVFHVLYRYGEWKIVEDTFDNCSCTRVCQRTEFKVQYIQTKPYANDSAKVRIRLEDALDSVVREYYSYPFSLMISDLSGIFGFFLGMSLFGIFELMQKFLVRYVIIRR